MYRILRRLTAPLVARRFASAGAGLVFDPLSPRIRGRRHIAIGFSSAMGRISLFTKDSPSLMTSCSGLRS